MNRALTPPDVDTEAGSRNSTSAPLQARDHHSVSMHEVVLLLDTDPERGLCGDDIESRRERFGPNVLPFVGGPGWLRRVLEQFHNPLIYVLLIAGAVTATLGEHVDSAVIFGVVIVNAIVGFIQESKAEAALESLRSMVQTTARVIRDGRQRTIPSDELVPGDLVHLDAGDKVPADLRLIRLNELYCD